MSKTPEQQAQAAQAVMQGMQMASDHPEAATAAVSVRRCPLFRNSPWSARNLLLFEWVHPKMAAATPSSRAGTVCRSLSSNPEK